MRNLITKTGVWLLAVGLCSPAGATAADESNASALPESSLANLEQQRVGPSIVRKSLGVELASQDEKFVLNAWLRAQFRYSDPFDSDPLRASDFDNEPGEQLEVRRVRVKAEGHLFTPRIGFYYEQEVTGSSPLLDLRLDIDAGYGVLVRAGQYKVLYNRERIDSSGKQQFVERSIATYAFTLDRQQGITVGRHFADGSTFDNWLFVGVFDGDGRDPGMRGDDPMLMARWQWQFLGEKLAFSQGDYDFRTTHAASLAFAGSTVRGPYTRFSSAGGGQLNGFQQTTDDRYTLKQWLQEFAWQYDGMSVQQEFHIKKISDHETGARSELTGGYMQFGKAWPIQLLSKSCAWELALRIARVAWEDTFPAREQDEVTAAANLFFAGHNNKLTVDVSRISVDESTLAGRHDMRYRLQWDVSL